LGRPESGKALGKFGKAGDFTSDSATLTVSGPGCEKLYLGLFNAILLKMLSSFAVMVKKSQSRDLQQAVVIKKL